MKTDWPDRQPDRNEGSPTTVTIDRANARSQEAAGERKSKKEAGRGRAASPTPSLSLSLSLSLGPSLPPSGVSAVSEQTPDHWRPA